MPGVVFSMSVASYISWQYYLPGTALDSEMAAEVFFEQFSLSGFVRKSKAHRLDRGRK